MGDLVQLDEYKWAAWTGGKPLPTWKGLDPTAKTYPATPHQRRFGKDITGFETRCSGLSIRYKKGDNLHEFMKRLNDIFVLRGLDTICYLADPANPKEMQHIVNEHTRFNLKLVQKAAPVHCANFDPYDSENDTAARMCLLDSVELKIRKMLETKTNTTDSFLVTWMTFINLLQSDSVQKYDALSAKIASRTPFMYPGQNISEMAAHMKADCEDLFASGFYKQTLTLSVLQAFALANGDPLYNLGLLNLYPQVQQRILEIRYMTEQDQQDTLDKEGLSFAHICDKAKALYMDAMNLKKWPASTHNKDSKTPPAAFANLSEVQAMALRQHMGDTPCRKEHV